MMPEPQRGRLRLVDFMQLLADGYEIEREWRTRTSVLSLWMFRGGEPTPRIAVKVPHTFSEEDPSRLYEDMQQCLDYADLNKLTRITPVPRAWDRDPPYIAYEWIDGEQLGHAIQTIEPGPEGLKWATTRAAETGALIRQFHSTFSDLNRADCEETVSHRGGAHRAISLLAPSGTRSRNLTRSLMDPGPHNIVIDESNCLRLIDLPSDVVLRPPEYDLARMALKLSRRVETALRDSWRANGKIQELILSGVLDGYQSRGAGLVSRSEALSLAYAVQSTDSAARIRTHIRERPLRAKKLTSEGLRTLFAVRRSLAERMRS